MTNDSRGSIWRRWDLHLHSPSSFDYGCMSVTDERFVENLIASGLSAVVISDHHVIDVARILNLRQVANGRLVVFPGIELRSELGGSQSVHYIGIFPDDCDLADVWTKLQGQLNITPQDVQRVTDQRVYVPFVRGAECIHKLGGIVSVHAGRKENSIECIANAEQFKQQVKEDLARQHLDILEIGSLKDQRGYQEIVFPHLGFKLPLVVGSDNHDLRSYEPKTPCWFKADVTFRGLLHVLHEPEDRVYLGPVPPSVERVEQNKTKYIRSISLARVPDSSLTEEWFSGTVPLNHGLVAIIGNKGSGKSALADIIGLLGDSPRGESFSFLNPLKFRQPRDNKARHFKAEITWESSGRSSRSLNDTVDSAAVESVKYVPQAYLEKVCNELGKGGEGDFTRELRSVIFSHIDEADRLGYSNLEDLLAYHNSETASGIELLKRDLASAIQTLVGVQSKAAPEFRTALENQLAMKERELAAHDAAKPAAVTKPEADPAATQATAAVEARITAAQATVTQLEGEIAGLQAARTKQTKRIAAADRLLARIANLETQVETFKSESVLDCAELGISLAQILRFELSRQPVEDAKAAASEQLKLATNAVNPKNTTGPVANLDAAKKQIESLRLTLNEPQQRYQEYLAKLDAWTKRRAEIVGGQDIPGTCEYLKRQLTELDQVPAELQAAKADCVEKALAIYGKISALAASYRTVYRPVQEFISEHPLAKDRFELRFEAAVVAVDFEDQFLRMINQGRKGSFSGQDDGISRARTIVREADVNTEAGVRRFLETVERHLANDMRQDPPVSAAISTQLAKGVTSAGLYEFLYSLDYLKPHYTLQWGGKEIEQLSPGERGTLLLVFYLLIDRSDVPLVIDQPEENLDNQTVYDVLVPSVKEAKARRQILLVTHNPNLAVVCDADQVIHAALDKETGNRVTYTCGALENPVINKKVVDVLEGTRPAFENRERKYISFMDLKDRPSRGQGS